MAKGIEQSLSEAGTIGKRNGRFRVIWAITRKDIQASINNSQLVTMSILPIVIFLLYRLMVSGINNSGILDIAVYDLGNSQLVTAMQQNQALTLHTVSDEAALQEQINANEMSGLRIPADFDGAVAAGERPLLTIWLNPQRGLQAETLAWQRFLEAEVLKLGQQSLPAHLEWTMVESDGPFSGDRTLNSYLLVVVLTLILFMTGTNVVAMLIAEEKERKTAVLLTASPAHVSDIVWGKALAGALYIMTISAIVILINGGLTGNWPMALLFWSLGILASVSLGILAGSTAQSVKQCNSWLSLAVLFFLVPAWFLTLLNLPEPFHSIIKSIPSHFMVSGMNDALNQTALSSDNMTNLTVWTIFAVVMVAVAAWRVRVNPRSMIA